MNSLSEIYAARQDEEVMDKLASVAEAFGDDPEMVELFDSALEVVKEAGFEDPSEQIDAAVELTLSYLDELEMGKEAGADDELDLGLLAAEAAAEAGVTIEDIEKIASDEEAEDFGRLLAHRVAEMLED